MDLELTDVLDRDHLDPFPLQRRLEQSQAREGRRPARLGKVLHERDRLQERPTRPINNSILPHHLLDIELRFEMGNSTPSRGRDGRDDDMRDLGVNEGRKERGGLVELASGAGGFVFGDEIGGGEVESRERREGSRGAPKEGDLGGQRSECEARRGGGGSGQGEDFGGGSGVREEGADDGGALAAGCACDEDDRGA